jgi:hypothetical protein
MIHKVCEVDPMLCPQREGTMKAITFLTTHAVMDRIIDNLKLTFVEDRPPPLQAVYQELLMDADVSADSFL